MTAPKNEDGFPKKLTDNDYHKIANSLSSQDISQLANWLLLRIDEIHALYMGLKEKRSDVDEIKINEAIWKKLEKIRTSNNHRTNHPSFLSSFDSSSDENFRVNCNQVAKSIYYLEKMLTDIIDSWQKPGRFLNRRSRPAECLITKINNLDDYKFIARIVETLKETYQQYPHQDELLFPHKKNLSSLQILSITQCKNKFSY